MQHLFKFDVMLNGRYVCSMAMPYCPLWPMSEKEIADYVVQQRPSLKGKEFNIAF